MKIVATAGSWVLIDDGDDWVYYDVATAAEKRIEKPRFPQADVAAVAKWNYYRLREPIEIDSIGEIDLAEVQRRAIKPPLDDWYLG